MTAVVQADLRFLPGVLQREALRPALQAAAEAARASGHSLALLTLDIDQFKDYQDQAGEASAQQVLGQLGLLLEQLKPSAATLAYLGADEFVLILPDTSLAQAHALAERLRQRIAEALALLNRQPPLTATLGVAASPPGRDWLAEGLLALADARMTFAKRRLPPHRNQAWAGVLPSDWQARLALPAEAWPSL
ncbi:GGDEF domain-containing protein [Roseateles sp. DAIF2]|uniref:GGDEF domain-containing protein n=1 Tax=Roseateles sp. DAIF2 TaxID=2714952 RepID=UPI0018A2CA89|nr:GGDEF domain-containing protein [Roseateles sp. DAIF2]QPF74580.1 GGDEF domain-containing protein [Roseateles sp. DAIF2]